MADKSAETTSDFFEVRCKICNHFFFELTTADEKSESVVRIKCRKCNRLAKIRLSASLKDNSIYQRVAEQFVHHA